MESGFEIKDALEPSILGLFKEEVENMVRRRLLDNEISINENFQLEDYHNFVTDELHSRIWGKKNRTFSPEFLKSYEVDRWFNGILACVKKKNVLDIEGIGYPEVYFRLVRPCHGDDTFGAHGDGVFYTMANNIPEHTWSKWLKVWFPITFEPLANTLGFYPESMRIIPKFAYKVYSDKPRPVLVDSIEKFGQMKLPVQKVGEVAIFSPHLLHQAFNSGAKRSRVSIEFAVG